MITRHHIALSLICVLVPAMLLKEGGPFILFTLLAGTAAGAILPDIHMKRPSKIRLLTLSWLIVQAGRLTVVQIICFVYWLVFYIPINTHDKRLTHSIFGVLLYWLLCSVPALAVTVYVFGWDNCFLLLVFFCGMFWGMSLHLVQDLCTRKGIFPFYPLHNLKLNGSIRPCDINDPRIFCFHLQSVVVYLGFLCAWFFSDLQEISIYCLAILCFAASNIAMAAQSDVRIDWEGGIPAIRKEAVDG